jgi:hypothetical protein
MVLRENPTDERESLGQDLIDLDGRCGLHGGDLIRVGRGTVFINVAPNDLAELVW